MSKRSRQPTRRTTRMGAAVAVAEPTVTDLGQDVARCAEEAEDLSAAALQLRDKARARRHSAVHRVCEQVASQGTSWQSGLTERATELGAAPASRAGVAPLDNMRGLPTLTGEMARKLAEYTERLRLRRDRAAAAGDGRTADLLEEIARDVDDEQWFLEAMAPARR